MNVKVYENKLTTVLQCDEADKIALDLDFNEFKILESWRRHFRRSLGLVARMGFYNNAILA